MCDDQKREVKVPVKRRCPQCERSLPLTTDYWHRSRTSTYGFVSWCKECRRRNRKPVSRPRVPRWESKKRRWTPEEEQILREEYPVKPTSEVAAKLRRSEAAVRYRAHKRGVFKVRPGTTRPGLWLKAEEIAAAYGEGESLKSLAQEYDAATCTIKSILVSQGCAIRDQAYLARQRRREIEGVLHVQCTACGEWKPRRREFFRRNSSSSDGLSARCIHCEREHERRDMEENPDKHEQKRQATRNYHRRMRRGLWAAQWRLAADTLLNEEEDDD